MKKVYNHSTLPLTAPPAIQSDQYHVRDHAANVGIACFLVTLSSLLSATYLLSTIVPGFKPQHYTFILPLSFSAGIIAFSHALWKFTNDAREMLWTQYERQQDVIMQQIVKERGDNEYQKTFLPNPRGNGKQAIAVYLNSEQLNSIAYAAQNSGKLTVNFLDSIGVSRPRAEKLRQELARIGYAKFNNHSELIFTKTGLHSLQRL